MTTVSYPAEGNNGLNVAQWARMFSDQDGIVNDYTGLSCSLTRNSTTNVATVSTGLVSVNGYVLDITEAEDLAVGTTAATYHISAKYDPALNVADGSGNAPAAGPCRLVITTGPPSTAGGEAYVLLWTITRAANQALTAATTVDYRHWVGPNLEGDALPAGEKASPRVQTVGWGPYPRGSSFMERVAGDIWRLTLNADSSGLAWTSITNTTELTFPAPAALVAAPTGPVARMRKVAGEVMISGTLQRSNGANLSTTSAVTLGTLPVGWRPAGRTRFWCYAVAPGGDPVVAPIVVYDNTGIVEMQAPSPVIKWVDLSSIQFRAEG